MIKFETSAKTVVGGYNLLKLREVLLNKLIEKKVINEKEAQEIINSSFESNQEASLQLPEGVWD